MIGDVVGDLGQEALAYYLPKMQSHYTPDITIVNGENAAKNGRGIKAEIVHKFFDAGIDCITLGNHAWAQHEIFDLIDREPRLIRPANFPKGTPGRGYTIIQEKLAVVNLLGRTFMTALVDCPFRTMNRILEEVSVPVIVDFHAETTSEKLALAWYLDGKVLAVIGTHTHIQTADERILPGGTGYLTDVGMVGPYDGVIGMDRDLVIKRFLTQLPVRFELAMGRTQFSAVLIDADLPERRVKRMKRLLFNDDHPLFE